MSTAGQEATDWAPLPSASTIARMSKRTVSLTWLVAVLAAGVVGGFMLLHDAHLGSTGVVGGGFDRLLSHGWHIAVFFIVILVIMNMVLHRVLVQPIHELYLKLYTLTKGDRERIDLDSRISEVQEIADGINLLLSRPRVLIGMTMAATVSRECEAIRQIAESLDEEAPGSRVALLKSVARLEEIASMSPWSEEDE